MCYCAAISAYYYALERRFRGTALGHWGGGEPVRRSCSISTLPKRSGTFPHKTSSPADNDLFYRNIFSISRPSQAIQYP